MVKINLDHEKYQFTTKNVLERFNIDEKIVVAKGVDLRFYSNKGEPSLFVGGKQYAFESRGSLVFFLQKLQLNSTVMTSLSDATLTMVVNELLQKLTPTLNLVIDKNTNQFLTVAPTSANLVSWRKIIETVHEFFATLGEKTLYLTTHTGLGISIVLNDVDPLTNPDLDILRIEPQTSSSISIYHGVTKEEVPLRGWDENEIIEFLKQQLYEILAKDSALVKG